MLLSADNSYIYSTAYTFALCDVFLQTPNDVMKVYAFMGPKGSGKDTAAEFLAQALGTETNCLSVSLADGLKRATAALHGLDPHLFYDLASKDSPLEGSTETPRDLVIRLSETLAPMLGDDFHVSTRLRRLASRETYDALIVPDLRLISEYEAMRKLYREDLTIILVDRNLPVGEHRTEREHLKILEMDPGHVVLDNTGSLEKLRDQVSAIPKRHVELRRAVPSN